MFHVEQWEACGRFVWLSGGKLGRFAPLVAAARPWQMFHVEHSAISVSIQRLTDGMFHAEQIQQLGMRALRFARACEYGMPPGAFDPRGTTLRLPPRYTVSEAFHVEHFCCGIK